MSRGGGGERIKERKRKREQRHDFLMPRFRTSRMTPSQSKIKAQTWLVAPPANRRLAAVPRRGCCCCCLWREAKADLEEDKEDAGKRKAWEKRAAGRRRTRRGKAWLRRGMVMVLLWL